MPAPVKPTIDKALLEKLDIRVGTIASVGDVAGSDKLVALVVDFGDHTRTILAGLKKERARPGELAGKQALFVVNLAPRKMAGVTSEGMLFDIGYEDGILPALAMPERPVPNGSRAPDSAASHLAGLTRGLGALAPARFNMRQRQQSGRTPWGFSRARRSG